MNDSLGTGMHFPYTILASFILFFFVIRAVQVLRFFNRPKLPLFR
jgi:hypothetical protein